MKREILFRGKDVLTGKWVQGNGVNFGDNFTEIFHKKEGDDYGTRTHVIPETVGQYTGRRDSQNKECLYGDIIKTNYGTIYEVGWHEQYGTSIFLHHKNEHGSHRVFSGTLTSSKFIVPEEMKWLILGNIHDNPELIK